MACFVQGDGALLVCGEEFGLLLQTTDDAVNSVEEALLIHPIFVVAGGNESGLVAHVGDVSA